MLNGAKAGGEDVAEVVDDLHGAPFADALLEVGAMERVSLLRLI